MLSKKVWPFALVAVMGLVFFFVTSWGFDKTEPASKYEKIITTVASLLEDAHYSPKKFDDTFSKEVFKEYLNQIDPDRQILLQADIEKLRPFETQIDNELRTGRVEFVPALEDIYKVRLEEAASIYKKILANPFDFTKQESVQLDKEKLPFAANEKEREENWRKRLKYMTLERYADALEVREKNIDSANFVVKADTTLERESRDRVLRAWNRTFDRLRVKFTMDEKFNMYVNTIAETMDPHTEFYPPVEKRAFDEAMSGRFFGIGAQLGEQDGNIKIVSLVTGSPAWKSGDVQVNDVILKVAQGAAEPVDLAGFETTDAVKLIRGSKGTEVRLTLKKTDGSIKVISLVRDEIVQEETFARSAIIKKENKIGYVYLPEFYANFEDPKGARSARDVAAEVNKLMDEKVDGIVIDLRFNGGGSLQDVIQMVGLFIEDGPVVQVKDRNGEASVYRDREKGVMYNGPLAVMINEFSASASEIFAAAIQDYKRGIVIGSQSFGKGTVQRPIGLDRTMGFLMPTSELGSLKLTLQKFYRINGGSTQLKGVQPNIVLPDNYEFSKFREKDNPHSLEWDEIPMADYKPWAYGAEVEQVARLYQPLVQGKDQFNKIRENAAWLSKVSDSEVSLNVVAYREVQKQIKQRAKELESLQQSKEHISVDFMKSDEDRLSKMDKDKADRFRNWLKGLRTDLYLDETANVLNLLIEKDKTARR